MFLSTLKHGVRCDLNGRMLQITGPTFEHMDIGYFNKICPLLLVNAVQKYESSFAMSLLFREGTQFKNNKFALYAIDVTLHSTNRTSGNHDESNGYFIHKHNPYGYKTEFSILPNVFAMGCVPHCAGSVAYNTICNESITFLGKATSEKEEEELQEIPDVSFL